MTPAELREQLGLSQEAMAAHLGVSRATWVRIETGIDQQTRKPVEIDRRTRFALAAIAAGLEPI